MKVCKGYINSIYSGSAVDGKGLRVVVFFSGCNLHCKFCHNPETLYLKGQETTVEELVNKILRYKAYIKKGGVTLSGGEPFLQKEFALNVIKELKNHGIQTVIETNGHLIDKDLIKESEYLIVDVKNQEEKELLKYRQFLSLCQQLDKKVELTSVIIKEVNDSETDILPLKKLKEEYSCVTNIRLLPFHKMCVEKYEKLDKEFLYKDKIEPSREDIERLKAFLN